MSKGSTRRKPQVSEEQVRANWDKIFGKSGLRAQQAKDKVMENSKLKADSSG